ncbi:hypothetical protein AAI421_17965 [Rhodococcus aetherivorans]|uniref:hypothetical protein n=1 Tax=Rhodococcus aetherivorans TaxID=191292 RepID=UPI0031DD4563
MRLEDLTEEHIATASLVLAKCASFDPWFPNGGDAVTLAWAEAFAESRLAREDLLAGVARMYRHAGEDGVRPVPGIIIRHATAAYSEALALLPAERRARMIDAEHALQNMGITPPEAHHIARRVALGRDPGRKLTRAQRDELEHRLAERRALESGPSRGIALRELVARAFRSVGRA